MAGGVQRGADRGDLPVHHPRRGDHVGPGLSLGDGHGLVGGQGGVIVDLTGARAVGADEPAVAVAGELIQAGVRAHNDLVPDLRAHGRDPAVEDAVLGPGRGAGLVPGGGNAEQVDGADAGLGAGGGLATQRVQRVLDDPRHRLHGAGVVNVLAHEHRQDESGWVHDVLAGQAPHCGRGAQAPGADRGGLGVGDGAARQEVSGRSECVGHEVLLVVVGPPPRRPSTVLE